MLAVGKGIHSEAVITWRESALFVVALLALVVCGLDDIPQALLVLMLVSFVAAGCEVAAVLWRGRREQILRAGHRVLGLLFILTLTAFLFSAGDWMHMLWNVQYPLAGLLLGSGLLLVRVWPGERRQHPGPARGWNGAVVALIAVVVLGAVPLLLASSPIEPFPTGRVSGSPFPALLEVARYGFDQTVPALMHPETPQQISRGLGHPPRFVTVTMAATQLTAWYWILFVGLALAGRAIPAGEVRWRFFLMSPLVLAPAAILLSIFRSSVYEAIWNNEPWFVRAYGPSLLAAAGAALVLLVAVRRDDSLERRRS